MHSGRRNKNQTVVVKWLVLVTGICVVGYIAGPLLYWQLSDLLTFALGGGGGASTSSSSSSRDYVRYRHSYCPPCICDCSQPLISFPSDCMKNEIPEKSDDADKSFIDLLTDELRLKEEAAQEQHRRADVSLLEAKKMASQYQKEADKCNSGMDTCEEAREEVEANLEAQRKLSALWELRARQRGWKLDS